MCKDLFDKRIGIIGAGNIGLSVALKLLEKGFSRDNLSLSYNASIFTFERLYDNDLVDCISSNSRIVDECDVILLCVPPQRFKEIGDFGLDDSKLVVSFMAGISIDDIISQSGTSNVVRVIPTGPDSIRDSRAVAACYPSCDLSDELFGVLDFDCYTFDCEEDLDYMVIAGCLPAVFCVADPSVSDNRDDICRFGRDFPVFVEIASKCEDLVPHESRDDFVSSVATGGGVTEAILSGLDSGKSLYESLCDGLERNTQLSK